MPNLTCMLSLKFCDKSKSSGIATCCSSTTCSTCDNGDGEVDITEFDITESDVIFFQEIDITESDVTKKGN